MATTFDSFLNATIPYAILVIGIFLLWRPLRGPIGEAIDAIKGLFHKKGEETTTVYEKQVQWQ